ncbi:MAG: S8 family serine peptidase [Acidimicrobiales bacterium]
MVRRAIIATAALAAGLVVLPSVAVLAAGPGSEPGSEPGPSAARVVPGAVAASSALPKALEGTQRFLVSFTDPSVPDAIRGAGFTVGSVLERLSIAVVVTEPERRDELAAVPGVASVSEDRMVSRAATQVLPGGTTQWNLDRIDQATNAYDQRYRYPGTGEGVRVYVFDGGVRPDHAEFSGRVVAGFTAIVPDDGYGTGDCDGHGTHVAGTIAGSTVGMAKRATIVPVRVLGCDGSGSGAGILDGVDWVLAQHVAGTPALANMSLGFDGVFTAMDDAVASLVAAGITVVVAAGNGGDDSVGDDACTVSPARAPSAITVGATTSSDARAGFSNFGTCVDLFAPGVSIRSASHNGAATAFRTMSGTSMASPAVAGIAAVYLGIDPTASPATVTAAITGAATAGAVTSPGTGSPNRLARVPAYSVPANDAFASAAALPAIAGTSTRTVSNVAADSESGEPVHAGVTGGASLWWTITPAVSGTLLLTTQGSGPDTALGLYTGSGVGSLTTVASNDDVAPGSSWSQVQRSVTSGTTYRIAVDTRYASTGSVVLGVTLVESAPPPSGAPGIPTGVTAEGAGTSATVSWTAPSPGGSPITGYTATATPGGATCTTATTTCTLTGLVAGSTYTVQVIATNGFGSSSPGITTFTVASVAVHPVSPVRLFDTRPEAPAGVVAVAKMAVSAGGVLKVKVAGVAGVPSSGVGAVSLNVTVTQPAGPGFVTVYPCGDRPLASNVNFVAGQTVPNAVIAPVSAQGEVCFYSMATTHLIADVNGWFAA